MGLFWPDTTDARARNALAQALHVIRKELGSEVIRTVGSNQVAVDASTLWVDVRAFRAGFDEGRWAEALERYRGDYLSGFHLSRADAFERWLDQERRDLRRLAGEAALKAAVSEERRGALATALDYTRRGMALAPYEERRLRHAMALLVQMGDRAKAVQEYEAFRTRLRDDLDMEPSERSAAAYRALLEGGVPSSLQTPGGTAVDAGVASASPRSTGLHAQTTRDADRAPRDADQAARDTDVPPADADHSPGSHRPRAPLAGIGAVVGAVLCC